jgi:ABC-type Fe3+-hydroxamate transport system substrate-binding protein
MKTFRQIFSAICFAWFFALTGAGIFAADALPSSIPAFPFSVTDGVGRIVKLANAPHRIISLSPAATDILIKIGAHAELVGVTRYCSIPLADESHVQRLGGVLDPDYEGLLTLKPD